MIKKKLSRAAASGSTHYQGKWPQEDEMWHLLLWWQKSELILTGVWANLDLDISSKIHVN